MGGIGEKGVVCNRSEAYRALETVIRDEPKPYQIAVRNILLLPLSNTSVSVHCLVVVTKEYEDRKRITSNITGNGRLSGDKGRVSNCLPFYAFALGRRNPLSHPVSGGKSGGF